MIARIVARLILFLTGLPHRRRLRAVERAVREGKSPKEAARLVGERLPEDVTRLRRIVHENTKPAPRRR